METVQLQKRGLLQQLFYLVHAEKVAAYVQHEAAPGIAGAILQIEAGQIGPFFSQQLVKRDEGQGRSRTATRLHR